MVKKYSTFCGRKWRMYAWSWWSDDLLASDNGTTWVRRKLRSCFNGSQIVGEKYCLGCASRYEEMELVNEEKNWTDAEQHCASRISETPRFEHFSHDVYSKCDTIL